MRHEDKDVRSEQHAAAGPGKSTERTAQKFRHLLKSQQMQMYLVLRVEKQPCRVAFLRGLHGKALISGLAVSPCHFFLKIDFSRYESRSNLLKACE